MAREELVKVPAVILGSRLRAKRKGQKMSQHQLGGEDFSPSYVSAVERGKIRPSLKALYILADRLGEPVTYFLQDEGDIHSADAVDDALVAARMSILQGKPQDAIASLNALPTSQLPPQAAVRVRQYLGEAYAASRRLAEAIGEFQEAIRIAEASNDQRLAAELSIRLGDAYLMQHKPNLAIEVHRRSLHILTQSGVRDVGLLLQAYASLCRGLLALGQVDAALACHKEAAERIGGVTDLRTLASALWATSKEYAAANDAPRARAYAEKSLCAVETLSTFAAAAQLRATYAAALAASGQTSEAEAMYRAAKDMSERIGDHSIAADTTIRMGELAARQEDFAQAEALISEGIAQANQNGDDAIAGEGMLALAQVFQAQGRRAAAEEHFRNAIAVLENAGLNGALSNAYFRFGQALVSWGETASVLSSWKRRTCAVGSLSPTAARRWSTRCAPTTPPPEERRRGTEGSCCFLEPARPRRDANRRHTARTSPA